MGEQNISAAAESAGLPVKTVRYYSDIGLVQASGRTESGYRMFDERAISKLIFVRRARDFGFSIDQCRELLSLYEDPNRTSQEVKQIATARLNEIEAKQRELTLLQTELSHLVNCCSGDDRPDCPIIEHLA